MTNHSERDDGVSHRWKTPATSGFAVMLFLGAVVLVSGCAKNPYIPVEGVVLQGGEPAEGYSVLFHPIDGKGQPAAGRTDSDGRFYLSTVQDGDGAVPAEYKVLILSPGHRFPRAPGKNSGPDYTTPDKTPLTCKVPTDGKVRFELAGKPDAVEKTGPSLLDQRPPPRK